MSRHGYFDWSNDAVASLRDLYQQGLSFTKIARTLGCTKPSAVAKAQRLGITSRASPIIVRPQSKQTETLRRDCSRRSRRADNLAFNRGTQPADLSDLPGFDNFGIDWEARWRFGGWSGTGVDLWQPKVCQFIGWAESRPACGVPVVPGRAYCRRHLVVCTRAEPI
ncbi:MAG: hypothetical protein O7C63_09310 [Alphaproteobacteria bacterium]|nr:hypothetical protein [Alphaproteobacteria bacterium]MCZ6765117.1 hypothetical protein [Alphaproteobacteria bacterium]